MTHFSWWLGWRILYPKCLFNSLENQSLGHEIPTLNTDWNRNGALPEHNVTCRQQTKQSVFATTRRIKPTPQLIIT